MPRIIVNNPRNVIDAHLKTNYFKLKNTGGPKGDKGDKGDTGATGPQGPTGATGATGRAATVAIGTTQTLNPGQSAFVNNVGTNNDAIFNFGIPQGDKGDKGDTGATGATGQAATVTVGTTTTLAPGSDATVTNSGTSSAAVFNFGVPQGATGATGAQGPVGSVKSTVVSELPASGNSDTFYLVDREATTGTASGTYITIDNPEPNGEISDYDILGDAEQDGTPTPDAPVTVNTVTGEQTARITGRNLLDILSPTRTNTRYGVTVTIADDGLITIDGTATGNQWPDLIYGIEANTIARSGTKITYEESTVIMSAKVVGGTATGTGNAGISVYYNDAGDKSTVIRYNDMNATPTTTATYGINRAFMYIPNGAVFNNYSFYLMVERGSTASQFEPYQGQEFEVNLGKNLLENTHAQNTTTSNDMSFTVNADGTITLNGTASALTWFVFHSSALDIPDGTYTISLQGGTSNGIGIYNDKFGNTLLGTSTTKTITNASGNVSIRVASGTSATNLTVKPMIERGSSMTTYAPYFTPIELCKIGTYQDKIYKSAGKWYLHKETGKVVLDGTEATGWGWADTNRYTFTISNIGARAGICDHFTYINYTGAGSTTSPSFDVSSNLASIGFFDDTISSLTNFKTWLGTHNTTVYYALATATDTEITEQALIDQLEALLGAELYSGQNNISSTSAANLAGTLDITYAFFDKTNKHKVYIWSDSDNTWQIIVQ